MLLYFQFIEPPKSVSIVDQYGNEWKDVVTYKEGSQARLICQTPSGKCMNSHIMFTEPQVL